MPYNSILIMAGGTGGHVYPALAVAEYLRQRGIKLQWLGTRLGLEYEVVPENDIELLTINVKGLRGKGVGRWLLSPFIIAVALLQALKIMLERKPAAVLGMGGFVSGPGGLAAWLLRRPLYIHEQNAVAGLTNRFLAPFARKIMQGFPGTFTGDKVITTGNPVRSDILRLAARQRPIKADSDVMQLLVLGGSLGARALNEIVPRALGLLPREVKLNVWHQTGRDHIDSTVKDYTDGAIGGSRVVPYINNMAEAYAWADLVLCRAGALTISEICIAGVASILVPYPHAVDDHQTANARFLSDDGGAVLVPQSDLTASFLAGLLAELYHEQTRLAAMGEKAKAKGRPKAAGDVGDLCMETVYA